jgi:iron(III) transport system substrate-binding protein
MKKLLYAILFLAAAALSFAAGRKTGDAGTLRIYSVINEEETQQLAALFTEQTGIRVEYIRAATGELFNRVIAEKGAPQADIVLGGSESLHIKAASEGAYLNYTPGAVSIPDYARAKDGAWNGFCLLTLGIGVNEQRFAEKFPGKPYPATWSDLADEAYKGELIFTDPVASQTGYLFLHSRLQQLGENAGFAYFKRIYPLAGQLPASGNTPSKLISTGEYTICVSFVHAMEIYAAQGYPIKIIIPPETPAEIDAVAIVKGGPNTEAAKRFVDFMLGKEAGEIFARLSHTIPLNPDVPSRASASSLDLMNYDSDRASRERDAVLERWQREVL